MTKDPQLTTHNAERGAHGTCRERSETGSSPKRTEKKVGFSLISEISWRFRVKCSVVWRKRVARYVGDLEEMCSVIWRKLIRRFTAKKCVGDLEKSLGDFGENHPATTLEIWRNLFGEIVVGDLEKSFGDIGENRSTITLEIWRNVVGIVLSISYWSSLWSSIELSDLKWG